MIYKQYFYYTGLRFLLYPIRIVHDAVVSAFTRNDTEIQVLQDVASLIESVSALRERLSCVNVRQTIV